MSDIYTKMTIKKRINLHPQEMKQNYQDLLLKQLKESVDGKNIKEGNVKKGSVSIVKRSVGEVNNGLFNGNMIYEIYYVADICNPVRGMEFECKVVNINKLGIKAILDCLLVIVPRELHDNKELFANVEQGDMIRVTVIDKEIELGSDSITVVGRFSADIKGKSKINIEKPTEKPVDEEEILDEEDVIDEDTTDEESEGEGDDETNVDSTADVDSAIDSEVEDQEEEDSDEDAGDSAIEDSEDAISEGEDFDDDE